MRIQKYSKIANFDKSENAKQFHKEKVELEHKIINALRETQIPWLLIQERYLNKGHLPKGYIIRLLEFVIDLLSPTPIFHGDPRDNDEFYRNYLRRDLTPENKAAADKALKQNPNFKKIIVDILEEQGIVDIDELYDKEMNTAAYWLFEILRYVSETEPVDFWKYKEEPTYDEDAIRQNPEILTEERFYIENDEAIVEYSGEDFFIVKPQTVAAFNFYVSGSWLTSDYFSENVFLVIEKGDSASGFLIDIENHIYKDRGNDTVSPKEIFEQHPVIEQVLKKNYVNEEFYNTLYSVYKHTEKGIEVPLDELADVTDEKETTFDKISQGDFFFDDYYEESVSDILQYRKINPQNHKLITEYLQKNYAEEILDLDESEVYEFIEEYVEEISQAIKTAYSDAYSSNQEYKYLQSILKQCKDYFPFDFTGYYSGGNVYMSDALVDKYWYIFLPLNWLKKLRKNQHYEVILSSVEEPISAEDISNYAAHAAEYVSVNDNDFNEALSNRLYEVG